MRPAAEKNPRALAFAAVFLVMVGSTLGAALAITGRSAPATGAPLAIGFPSTADAQFMLEDTEQLRHWLEKSLDRPVTIAIATSYDALQARLLHDELDLAALPPYLYVETKQKNPRIQIIATKMVEGSSGNDSIIYVSDASNVTEVSGLKHKTFCVPDFKSTTGYLFPARRVQEGGARSRQGPRHPPVRSHMQAMRDLLSGVCDAAATYSGGFLAADRAGVPVARAHQLAIIGRSPHDAMVVRASMTDAEREKIRDALLSFKPSDGGKSGRVERISGFEKARNRDYDAVREALSAAK